MSSEGTEAPCGFCVQDLTLKHGWRTGAIIPELRSELRIMNTEQYIQTMTWLQTLTGLLEQMQVGYFCFISSHFPPLSHKMIADQNNVLCSVSDYEV